MFIDIEGVDGSGKGTQTRLLCDRLRSSGFSAEVVEFPRYAHTFFGAEVGRYLNGEFGDLQSVHPKLAALLYAGDRFESRDYFESMRARHEVVVSDRFTASNKAHHAAKLPIQQRPDFFKWVDRLEHDVFRIPRPDLIVFLDVGVQFISDMIRRKPTRSYTSRSADIHEVDIDYQSEVRRCFDLLRGGPEWRTVQCDSDGELLRPEAIHQRVWNAVHPLLIRRQALR